MPSKKVIIVAANPYQYYQISTAQSTRDIGNVEYHKEHLDRHGGVFWDVIPAGRRDTPWNHPEVDSGYFYISRQGKVRYRFHIEYIKRWKEIDKNKVKNYIPDARMTYIESYPDAEIYYAILIKELEPLRFDRTLDEFRLASTDKPVERVRNYVLAYD